MWEAKSNRHEWYDRLNNGLPKCLVWIPRTCDYVTLPGKRNLAYVIKDFEMERWSGWAQCHHKGSYKREEGRSEIWQKRCENRSRSWGDVLWRWRKKPTRRGSVLKQERDMNWWWRNNNSSFIWGGLFCIKQCSKPCFKLSHLILISPGEVKTVIPFASWENRDPASASNLVTLSQ